MFQNRLKLSIKQMSHHLKFDAFFQKQNDAKE